MKIKTQLNKYYSILIKIFFQKINIFRRNFHYKKYWPYLYKKYSKKPIDEKKVVLAYSEIYKKMPDNLVTVKEYLEAMGYNCVVIDRGDSARRSNNRLINEIKKFFYGKEFFKDYATAKALFLTDYFFPAYAAQPREGQSVVQLWHGCGAFKKWGYSLADKKWGASKKQLEECPVHNTYTHICVSSPKVKFAYAEAFGIGEENVMPIGSPRTDVYFDKEFVKSCREKVLKTFPEIGNRKIILYAPTFRGYSVAASYIENMMSFEKMQRELGEDYALVIKLHPLTAKSFNILDTDNFVFNATECLEIETALCAADMVITDYSSLIFEYALLERPMIFFAYDLESYGDARDFYFPYESFVPGEIVRNTREIIDEIKRLETDFNVERVRRFKEDFMCSCDGKSTERILEISLGLKPDKKAAERKETAVIS